MNTQHTIALTRDLSNRVLDYNPRPLTSSLAVFSAMALTAFGQQLPEPLLYFPLDEASGATAAVDKTGNGSGSC